MSTERIGDLLASRYRLEAILGAGGMGTVYAAHDSVLGRTVAIKLIREDLVGHPVYLSRFTQEAKTIAQLSSNPHILAIYDFGVTEEGLAYIVAEHLRGRTLKSILKDPYQAARSWVLEMGVQVASALADMHAKGFVHGDLKPGNIFVVQTETLSLLTKVIDFGLSHQGARPAGGAAPEGAVAGTPAYLAPEVIAGLPPTDASDIYAFGVTLYEVATGGHPYAGRSVAELLQAHRFASVPGFPEHPIPFPASFQELVLAMLHKEPASRPRARECLRRLSSCSRELEQWKPSP